MYQLHLYFDYALDRERRESTKMPKRFRIN